MTSASNGSANSRYSIELFQNQGYLSVLRDEPSDVYAALMPLLFTTAICFDLHSHGFCERFCFESRERATEELLAWHKRGFDDQRPIGWVACRGVPAYALQESLEKAHGEGYAARTLDAYKSLPLQSQGSPAEDAIVAKMGLERSVVRHELAYLRHIGKVI